MDRCGDFICKAEERFDCILNGVESAVCKLEIPETGMHISISSNDLTVTQEIPETAGEEFLQIVIGLCALGVDLFNPRSIVRNGFASKTYVPFDNERTLFEKSLKFGGTHAQELAKVIGMEALFKNWNCTFGSGSKQLRIDCSLANLKRTSLSMQQPNVRSTRTERRVIDRKNTLARKANHFPSVYALVLNLDLTEDDPPIENDLSKHFGELRTQTAHLNRELKL